MKKYISDEEAVLFYDEGYEVYAEFTILHKIIHTDEGPKMIEINSVSRYYILVENNIIN